MIKSALLLLLILALTNFARTRWKRRNKRQAEDAFGALHGCQRIQARTRGRLPLNLDLLKGLWDANRDHRLLAYQKPFVDELGANLEQHLLGDFGIVTLDPENIKAILSNPSDYVFGTRRDASYPLLGEGIFTQDGAAWKHSRELLRKHFVRIQYHNLDIFTEHIELLVKQIRIRHAESAVVDLHSLFFNFTLDTTTSLLFGESAGTLEDPNDEFGKALDEAEWITAARVKLVDAYWLYRPRRYIDACEKVKKYARNYVDKALDHMDHNPDSNDPYLFVKSLYTDLKDRALVRDQLINVLVAGRDTTAVCLSWTFRLLVRHHHVLQRLKDEIRHILGDTTQVTKSHVQNMPYLKIVITEVLRLYPSVPVNVRIARRPTILPRGGGTDGQSPVLIREGMGAGYTVYHMHRREELYGEDANEFRPERWEDGKLREEVGWGYLPFNGGPRVCLGQEFALLEASYAIVRIIQAFPNITLPADEKVEPSGSERQLLSFTLAPVDGCRVKLG